ncbi:CocE/NonD family hydrolase [Curvivirga sp.]|uniref:CocE/NonD family hydrolase n=1 Tax=Curvivirga sp. TaxID=2856848 RepID=UPI003B5C6F31
MKTKHIENEWIILPDGRRLAACLWMPERDGKYPVILEYLPYRKRDGTAPRDETTHTVFAKAGYVCIRVDIAGTGDSEGQFDDEYSEQELSDGEAILDWITHQDWCDGNIGIIGISWGGFNGLQLAYRQPESLKAVVSVASTADRYADDIHYMGGCLLTDNFNWSSQMFAYLTRPADPDLRKDWREDWLQRLKNTPFSAKDWMVHPNRDEFWKHGSICENWSKIKAPVLAITGWGDSYVNTPALLAEKLNVPCKALVGPWEHRYAHISKIEPADFHSEVLGWFDRWLKGEQNGAEDLPAYRTFMQEHYNPTEKYMPRKGRWIAEESWPSSNIHEEIYNLSSDGLTKEKREGEIVVSTPAHVGQNAGYFCPGMRYDNEMAGDQTEDDANSSCFDLDIVETLELMGRPKLRFKFSVDKPVAQLVARLCDVSPDGISQRITYRPLNLNHYDSHETPEYLEVGKVYEAEIQLNECAHHLKQGHKLRLALSTSYWPITWTNPEAIAVTLYQADCELVLPVRQVEEEIDPANPGLPSNYPILAENILREPSGTSKRQAQADGTITLDTFDDYGKAESSIHGLIVGSHVRVHNSIHPDQPNSANFEASWNFTFERDEWMVSIDTENKMHCDQDNFYISRKIRATEGIDDEEVYAKEWQETIPRGFN